MASYGNNSQKKGSNTYTGSKKKRKTGAGIGAMSRKEMEILRRAKVRKK